MKSISRMGTLQPDLDADHQRLFSSFQWEQCRGVMVCENNLGEEKQQLRPLLCRRYLSSQKEKGIWEPPQKGYSLIFWKVKVKEERTAFRLARFCFILFINFRDHPSHSQSDSGQYAIKNNSYCSKTGSITVVGLPQYLWLVFLVWTISKGRQEG